MIQSYFQYNPKQRGFSQESIFGLTNYMQFNQKLAIVITFIMLFSVVLERRWYYYHKNNPKADNTQPSFSGSTQEKPSPQSTSPVIPSEDTQKKNELNDSPSDFPSKSPIPINVSYHPNTNKITSPPVSNDNQEKNTFSPQKQTVNNQKISENQIPPPLPLTNFDQDLIPTDEYKTKAGDGIRKIIRNQYANLSEETKIQKLTAWIAEFNNIENVNNIPINSVIYIPKKNELHRIFQ